MRYTIVLKSNYYILWCFVVYFCGILPVIFVVKNAANN